MAVPRNERRFGQLQASLNQPSMSTVVIHST